MAEHLNQLEAPKAQGERVQRCVATGVLEDILSKGTAFHQVFDACMERDVYLDEDLSEELREAIAASRDRVRFRRWTKCYTDFVAGTAEVEKVTEQVEKVTSEKKTLLDKLDSAMKQVRQYEVQLEAERTARRDPAAVQQKLDQARKRTSALLQDIKDFIKMQQAELAKTKQERDKLGEGYGPLLRELDCRRAGGGNECKESPPPSALGVY